MLALSVMPFASFVQDLSDHAVSSLYTAVLIMETRVKGGGLFLSPSILALLLVPNKAAVLPYLFFRLYGIVKFYIEKSGNNPLRLS